MKSVDTWVNGTGITPMRVEKKCGVYFIKQGLNTIEIYDSHDAQMLINALRDVDKKIKLI